MTSSAGGQTTRSMERAWIISIGTELALGQSVDTNAAWLAEQLANQGIRCERHVTVPDDRALIRDAFRQASAACDLIIATGGLGPTEDDLTRQALAEAAGVELVVDAGSIDQIRAFFVRRGREMHDRNQVQALIPHGGRAISNRCGTAPGIWVELGGTPCFALPGVPYEMKTMFDREVLPHVVASASGRVLRSRLLRCYGMHEVAIGERLRDLMAPGRNPGVGTAAELGVITVRINARGESRAAADALLAETEGEIRRRLGRVVFGGERDTLASVVGEELAKRGRTVSTAESCTGGLIAKLLTDVPGSSAYFVGGAVAYANEVKRDVLGVPPELMESYGAVSEPVARAMAEGSRRVFGSDYSLAVTGIAGPDGGTSDKPVGLVYLALATPADVTVRQVRFGSDLPRPVIRERAARSTLHLLHTRLAE